MKNIGSRFFHYIRVEKFILVVVLKTTRLIYALIQCNMNISKFKFLELVKHFNNECSIINILNMLSVFFFSNLSFDSYSEWSKTMLWRSSYHILPSWHLLVQIRKWKHKKNVWKLFKVLWVGFAHFCSGSIIDFEQVKTSFTS